MFLTRYQVHQEDDMLSSSKVAAAHPIGGEWRSEDQALMNPGTDDHTR